MARAEGHVMALRERTAQNDQTGAIREATFIRALVQGVVNTKQAGLKVKGQTEQENNT